MVAKPGVAPAHTKEEILDEAIQIISENGVEKLSIRGLAKRVGLSPMGIYTYFPSRQDLLMSILDYFVGDFQPNPIPGERWDDTIRRIAHVLADIINKHPQARQVNYELRDLYTQKHYRKVAAIHKNQGMPNDIYALAYAALYSFFNGFFEGQARMIMMRYVIQGEGREPDEWEQVVLDSFNEETLDMGLEMILAKIREVAAPDPCEWYTPVDPNEWPEG